MPGRVLASRPDPSRRAKIITERADRRSGAAGPVHFRVRQDRVDTNGTVTLRYQSKLRHIAVGRVHKHQPVRLFVAGDQVRVIREDGSLLRELTIDPGRDYQSLKVSSMS